MDLKEMRKQFNDILSSILSTKRADNNAFLTAAEYNMRIAEVKSSKTILLTPKVKKSVKDYRLVRKYDVTTIEGEDRLIKPIGNDLLSPVLHYVMNEELFDILHSTHTAMNHAGRNRMVTELKARYYNITKETIMAYLRLCEFCQRKLVNKKKELDPVVCQKQNSGKLLNELEAKDTPLCIMGKLNNKSGVEIIPINETSTGSSRSGEQVGGCLLNSSSANMQRVPYMSDPTIVPRVQKYLESNVDKTYVDINVMADELQRNYREYAKRKRSAFRASVKKAYAIVLQSYGLQDQGSSDDDEVSDSEPEEDSRHFISDNSMHNTLMDLYKGPTLPKQILDENELIDISSDESEEANYGNRASNGPSTSQPQYNPGPKKEQDKRYQAQNVERAKKRKIDSLGSGPISKSTPKKKKTAAVTQTNVVATFKDIGGMDKVLEEICKLLVHIKHPEIYKQIGISPPRGFLLHGPPGCGKTLLANAIAGELNVAMIKVAAPELVAGVSGESEERIRDLFERAVVQSPCVLFIDEIDAITPHRQNVQKEMERRIVAQLLSCLDDLTQKESGDRVLVIGATNRPDAIDPALRRAGRFDREISVGIPDVEARRHILQVLTSQLQLAEDFDFISLAKYTPGFVGADLLSLTREAAMNAVNRKFNDLKETRKIEEAMALQKALEESKKKPVAKPVEDDEVKEITSDSNKSDPEIIVDDDVSKDAPTASDSVNGTTPSAVVVIEDDQAKQTPETDVQIVNGEPKEEQEKLEQMPVDVSKPNISPLEELLAWLHDTSPISPEQLSSIFITMEDFGAALKRVQPSAKREGFATVPDTTWSDVGSLRDVREELQMAILAPVRHAEQFKALGLNVPTGVFLCGPPGCGKTLLAKAIANEAGINFISVKGPELLNMYVGESERAVRVCFERARNSAPCVIFFDELDALCPKRSDSRDGGPTMRVVNQMLTEMDGVEGRQGVFLLAASNRPDIIDPAVLRPGRLDKIIFVGLPTAVDRVDILRTITKDGTQPRLSPDVDLDSIGSSEQCRGYTGADLAALVREAAIVALKEVMILGDLQQPLMVNTEHFKRAVAKIRPSVSEKDQKHYEKLRKMYSAVPEIEVEEMEYS